MVRGSAGVAGVFGLGILREPGEGVVSEPGAMSIHWRNFAHAASPGETFGVGATDAFRVCRI